MVNRFENFYNRPPSPEPDPYVEVETEHTTETAERRDFLNRYFQEQAITNEDARATITHLSEYENMLNEWKSVLPPEAQSHVSKWLGSIDREISTAATPMQQQIVALHKQDMGQVQQLGKFGKTLKASFQQPGVEWDQLPEKNKRYIRFGELLDAYSTVFDSYIRKRKGLERNPDLDGLFRLGKSTDVPMIGEILKKMGVDDEGEDWKYGGGGPGFSDN